jgi:hypothetical protein
MGNYRVFFGITFAALATLGIVLYTQFEIYPSTVPVETSRAVKSNNFYALQKWLTETGHPVRVESRANIAALGEGREGLVFLQASLVDWHDAETLLKPWVEAGGFLLVSLDPSIIDDEDGPASFLAGIGVKAERASYTGEVIDDDENGDEGNDDEENVYAEVFDLDKRIRFSLTGEGTTLEDQPGIGRVAVVPLGKGRITVMGRPYFMWNDYIDRESNARLAWSLTGACFDTAAGSPAGNGNERVLFIRGRRVVRSFFGRLAERGNPLPLVVSAIILIVTGFWMALPAFGLTLAGDERPPRQIAERFRAEVFFRRRYHALEGYLETYLREIKRRQRGREPDPNCAVIENSLERSRASGKKLSNREIIVDLQILEKTVERL